MKAKSIPEFFWQHIKPYKWYYLVMLLAPLISSFYPFGYNYAVKLFLDTMVATEHLSYRVLFLPIGIFIFIQFMLDFVWRISQIAQWKSEPYVRRSIILKSYNYVQHHSYKFFQDNFAGAISSKLKGLLDGYDKFWEEMHHGLLNELMKSVVNIGALFIVNLYLGLFMFCWSITYIPVMYYLSKKLNRLTYDETETRHAIIGFISDKITNIISLFSFSARTKELQHLTNYVNSEFIPKEKKLYKYTFVVQLVGGLLYQVMIIFALFYIIHLKISNIISIGDVAFAFGIILVAAEDIWKVTVSLQNFARNMGDIKSALNVIQIPHASTDLEGAHQLEMLYPSIEFKNVSFKYDNNENVFERLSFSIKPGEKIGLVGHSGAGKSTLINLMLKYFTNQAGNILVSGENIKNITQDSLRDSIAVIPQDTLLFHRSIMENIRFGNSITSYEEVISAAKKAHINDFIASLPNGYETFVGERGIKLSGGQRQRIAIARAILKDAPILILDEATSSLDSHTEKLIQDSLNFFIEDKQKTVIAIAHRLSTLKHMDRIFVLDNGKIIEEGTHQTLINKPGSLYKKLWKYQEV